MKKNDQNAFERPDTLLNSILSRVVRHPSFHRIDELKIRTWCDEAVASFLHFFDESIIHKAIENANWIIDYGDPPKNVWAGEVLFNGRPTIKIYIQSFLTRVPTAALFDALGISLMHHVLGHIVPREAGLDRYDETVACRYQAEAAAVSKNLILRHVVRHMIPLFSWFHKNIPPLELGYCFSV